MVMFLSVVHVHIVMILYVVLWFVKWCGDWVGTFIGYLISIYKDRSDYSYIVEKFCLEKQP